MDGWMEDGWTDEWKMDSWMDGLTIKHGWMEKIAMPPIHRINSDKSLLSEPQIPCI